MYTHGFGAVASEVNTREPGGGADPRARGYPGAQHRRAAARTASDLLRRRRAGGLGLRHHEVGTPELDYEGAPTEPPYEYRGHGGIQIGNVLQRALFAWRFRDVNLLISGQFAETSRIMIYRDIYTRVPKPVPFLSFDRRSLSDDRRRAARVDLGRVYHHERLPVFGVDRSAGGDRWPASSGDGELYAQLGKGRGGRVRRHDDLLRRSHGPHHPGVGPRVPGPVHRHHQGRRRAAGISATPRTCSRCRRPASATTTWSSRGVLSEAGSVGDSRRPDPAAGRGHDGGHVHDGRVEADSLLPVDEGARRR